MAFTGDIVLVIGQYRGTDQIAILDFTFTEHNTTKILGMKQGKLFMPTADGEVELGTLMFIASPLMGEQLVTSLKHRGATVILNPTE